MDNTSDFDIFFKNVDPSKEEVLIEELQEQLTSERDARREDRFFFIVITVILFDIVFFTVIPNSAGPIALFLVQIIVLIPIAKKMGVEEIAIMLNSVLERVAYKASNDD
ncbi:MAG: hypothetical protein JJ879_13270 [Sneathiella sp.]|nr:hypothetical protein [Sneathiella sp.]